MNLFGLCVCASVTLPAVHQLRSWLRVAWAAQLDSVSADTIIEEIKLFPIRIINSGYRASSANLVSLDLPIPPWVHAFAYELEAARDSFTSHVRTTVRPHCEAVSRNKHFFAVEAIEGIVMQLFLIEVRKRCVAPSILWLHDGFWIDKNVDDEILFAAERHVRMTIFPASLGGDPLFRIIDLTDSSALVLASCPSSLSLLSPP